MPIRVRTTSDLSFSVKMIRTQELANRETAAKVARDARNGLPGHWRLRNKIRMRNRFPGSTRTVYTVAANEPYAVFHERGYHRQLADGSAVKHNIARRYMRNAVMRAKLSMRQRLANLLNGVLR